MVRWIVAVILWCAAVFLIIILSTSGDTAVKTIDLSAVKSEQVVAGTNLIQPDFKVPLLNFLGNSYGLVMVGVERSEVIFVGEKEGKWYQAKGESLNLGFTQKVKEVRVDGQTLIINCGKDGGQVVASALLCAVALGGIGGLVAKA